MQEKIATNYSSATERISLQKQSKSIFGGLGLGFSYAMRYFTYGLLYWYGAQLIQRGEITFTNFMTAMLGNYTLSIIYFNELFDIFDCDFFDYKNVFV